jgi:hypothetical protein
MLEMQAQVDRLKAETASLRTQLVQTRSQLASFESRQEPKLAASSTPRLNEGPHQQPSDGGVDAQRDTPGRIEKLEEDLQLLDAKVSDQYQTKIESASKYRMRLSGIALLNIFANRGPVDNADIPGLAVGTSALDSGKSFGATVRQSMLGLEVFGPSVAGAKTRGGVQVDFLGGFPNALNGATSGVMRIRTATFQMDWAHTAVVIGQDTPFISPLSPTSVATLAEPALSYAGNLWTWTPQVRVEHRLVVSEESSLTLQGGILDPLTGEPPYYGYYRTPQAGERSGQPAFASRIAWRRKTSGGPLTLGLGGYYSRQDWGFDRRMDGWAGTADWDVPLGEWFAFSGEFYRGRAVGGLGGGIGRSVIYNGTLTDRGTSIRGLDSTGGWGQIKLRPTGKLEFNGAFGQDNPFAADLRHFISPQSYFNALLARNRSVLANFIYHPRSNLLFSLEYRRLWTYQLENEPYRANHLNLAVGVLF